MDNSVTAKDISSTAAIEGNKEKIKDVELNEDITKVSKVKIETAQVVEETKFAEETTRIETILTVDETKVVLEETFLILTETTEELVDKAKVLDLSRSSEQIEDKAVSLKDETVLLVSNVEYKPVAAEPKETGLKQNPENIIVSSTGKFSMRITQAEPDISNNNEG